MKKLQALFYSISFLIGFGFCLFIWGPWRTPDVSGNIKLSEGRQQILEEELVKKTKEIDSLRIGYNSKIALIDSMNKNPEIVYKGYEKKIANVIALPTDGKLLFFANRFASKKSTR